MVEYKLTNFETGSFERLIQALSVKIIGPGIIIFGDGRDGGREATFEGQIAYPFVDNGWNGYGVIQAKFRKRPLADAENKYSEKDDEWALAQLKKELDIFLDPSKKRRKPDYYIFATNVVLTPVLDKGSKDKTLNLIKEYAEKVPLKGYAIWDYDQITSFIDNNSDVRNCYQHFLTSGDGYWVFVRC